MCFHFTHFPCDDWENIYVLCLIIIIKSEEWTITHCLGLGHGKMVCAVCLSVFLCNQNQNKTMFITTMHKYTEYIHNINNNGWMTMWEMKHSALVPLHLSHYVFISVNGSMALWILYRQYSMNYHYLQTIVTTKYSKGIESHNMT